MCMERELLNIKIMETQLQLLFKINKAIVSVQNKEDLIRVILSDVKDVFNFYDTGLAILNKEGDIAIDWVTANPELDPSDANIEVGKNNLIYFSFKNSLLDTCLHEVEQAGHPLIYSLNTSLIKRYPEHKENFRIMKKHGIKEVFFTYLKCRGKLLGSFNINATENNFFKEEDAAFFQAIADYVAIAVSNILDKEEILEREKEKTLLLSLSENISKVRGKDELLDVLINKVKEVIAYDDFPAIFLFDEEVLNYHIFYHKTFSVKETDTFWNWEKTKTAIANDPVAVKLVTNPVVQIWKTVNFPNEWANHPGAVIANENGFQETLHIPLFTQGRFLGILSFNAFKEGNFSMQNELLYKNAGELIAVSLANILANEEIIKREKEKALLLSLSEDMSAIRGRNDFWQVMMNKVKPLMLFDDAVLLVLTKDLKQYDFLLSISPNDRKNHSLFEQVTGANNVDETPIAWFLKVTEKCFVQDLAALESDQTYPSNDPSVILMKETGLWYSIIHKMYWGNQLLGIIAFHYKKDERQLLESKLNLSKSVVEQVTVAVANILANEEILEREKEKTVLLSLSENMANIRNRESLLSMLLEKIKPIVGFDDAVISKYSDDFRKYQHIVTASPPERRQHPMFDEIVSKEFEISDCPDEWVLKNIQENEVFRFDTEDIRRKYPEHFIGIFLQEVGLHYNLYLKLNWAGKLIGFMNFHFSNEKQINTGKYSLYKSIAEQISVALANVLANEEIATLNKQLQAQNDYLIEQVEQEYNFDEMIGQNEKFKEACKNIGLVSQTDSTVLILGETGTGKELVARAIHNHSPRKNKPLVKLNCAALPANLIESELFGHERGAFTGAVERRIGKFELANGSTLFLDEIGELPLELQAKLLRALQEKEIERLGSNKTIPVDVRIIAATNRDLTKEVKTGKFRQDLYYRLYIFPLTLPPLRERKEDIPLLAAHFIQKYAKKTGKKIHGLSNKALQEMMAYNFPGNIRELEHTIERCVILCQGRLIQTLNLPDAAKNNISYSPADFAIKPWADNEREYILEVLKYTKGNVTGKGGAADLLKLKPTTLQSKMLKLGIKRKHYIEN
jgi:formate hydrogenlyase transcriptional activator